MKVFFICIRFLEVNVALGGEGVNAFAVQAIQSERIQS
jgi:hypothetical protein